MPHPMNVVMMNRLMTMSSWMFWRAALVLLGLILLGGQEVALAAPAWGELSASQQKLLAGFKDRWDQLSESRRDNLARGAARWAALTPQQRELARQRLQQWRKMTPAQRQRLKQRFERFSRLPPEKRQRLRKRFEQFRKLPPAQRKALRARWRDLPAADKQRLLENRRRRFDRQRRTPRLNHSRD